MEEDGEYGRGMRGVYFMMSIICPIFASMCLWFSEWEIKGRFFGYIIFMLIGLMSLWALYDPVEAIID